MLSTIIIEDERPARELLMQTLSEIDNSIRVDAVLSSVKESVEYLATEPSADIIFSDVQLTDGYSFEIFKNKGGNIPVIFITGYDEFMMNAFSCNGIDYLLKPVSKKDLLHALHKYRMLEKHFAGHHHMTGNLARYMETRKKSRLVVKRGLEYLALRLEDIVLLYTENKLVYITDKWGKKYIGEKTLGDMELELDETTFFRANRQYIININFIKGFKPFEKVKLLIEMSMPELNHTIVISQEHAPQFRQWIYDA
ncbi:MAG: response regulator transcription factor [Ferruginibacter sp.]|nr:response regulator transcription factor [Chitinophagaceae bacterium]